MSAPHEGHAAVLLPSGSVLVVGGGGGIWVDSTTLEVYDPAADHWTVVADRGYALLSATATLLPTGSVLAAGGYNSLSEYTTSRADLFVLDAPLCNVCPGDGSCVRMPAGLSCGVCRTCDASGTCVVLADGAACDDGDACTVTSSCAAGACAAGSPLECPDDGIECTEERCDPATGCVVESHDDMCASGDPCVDVECLPGSGCEQWIRSGRWCDDGDPSTYPDRCTDDGRCVGTPDESEGCSCRAVGAGRPSLPAWLALGALSSVRAFARRSRRR